MWRCSGARRSVRPFFSADRGLCFDSPHLHTHPGVSLRFRGFRCPRALFTPLSHSLPCIRM
nr:MAG TPA: hypothetical protein [Caudoviricetes sp.]